MSLLYLNSNLSSNNTYTFDKKMDGHYKLVLFSFTNNIYNVNDTNNKIYFNENGLNLTATLTNGFNDITDLKTNIITAMNGVASGTISITEDDKTKKLTISNDTHNFYFTFSTNTNNTARKLMGFNANDGTNSTSQTSETAYDLNTYKNIWIDVNEDYNKNIKGLNYFQTSLCINGVGNFGEIVRYNKNDNFKQEILLRNVKKLKLQFHDINHNEINLNSEYELIFEKC